MSEFWLSVLKNTPLFTYNNKKKERNKTEKERKLKLGRLLSCDVFKRIVFWKEKKRKDFLALFSNRRYSV